MDRPLIIYQVLLQLAVKALSPKSKCRMMAVRTKRTRRTRPKGSVRADKFLKQCKAKKTPETEHGLAAKKIFSGSLLGLSGSAAPALQGLQGR